MTPSRERLILLALIVVGGGVFLTGIDWGLPSRDADRYLFGDRPAWSGAEIQRLSSAGGAAWDDPSRAADVDADPRPRSNHAIVVNATDADRAQIVRRYRLFSNQPDEMITLMSLARMRPGEGKLDPGMYQYGGLWVYPVGAMLKLAAMAGFVDLRSGADGIAYYLDHPQAFGRFYIVARLYSALWGLVGIWAMYRIVRRITGRPWIAAAGAACFFAMPVVVNMAHEAKPHLAGVVLTMLAVLAGSRYVERGRWRDAMLAGVLCGAATGMVLSAAVSLVILPVMVILRRPTWAARGRVVLAGMLAGVVTYCVTNPYVPYNLIANREVLRSNFSNLGQTGAIFGTWHIGEGLRNTAGLVAAGTSPLLAAVGAIGVVVLGIRALWMRKEQSDDEVRRRATGLLLAAPAVLVLLTFAPLAAGKPGEFGRFLLLVDVFLAVEAVVLIGTTIRRPRGQSSEQHSSTASNLFPPPVLRGREEKLPHPSRTSATSARLAAGGLLVVSTAIFGSAYLRAFLMDRQPVTSRLAAARELAALKNVRIAVRAEPAPYVAPPMNLFDNAILKLPPGMGDNWRESGALLLVEPVDVDPQAPAAQRLIAPRISWADKFIDVEGPDE